MPQSARFVLHNFGFYRSKGPSSFPAQHHNRRATSQTAEKGRQKSAIKMFSALSIQNFDGGQNTAVTSSYSTRVNPGRHAELSLLNEHHLSSMILMIIDETF